MAHQCVRARISLCGSFVFFENGDQMSTLFHICLFFFHNLTFLTKYCEKYIVLQKSNWTLNGCSVLWFYNVVVLFCLNQEELSPACWVWMEKRVLNKNKTIKEHQEQWASKLPAWVTEVKVHHWNKYRLLFKLVLKGSALHSLN